MPYEIDEDGSGVYGSADDKLSGLGLHPSHRWVYPEGGDCWHGEHTSFWCARCDLNPLPSYCYFDLCRTPEETARMLEARRDTAVPAAFELCPGESEDR